MQIWGRIDWKAKDSDDSWRPCVYTRPHRQTSCPTHISHHYRLHFPTAWLGGEARMTGSPLCRRGNWVLEMKDFHGHQRLPGAALKLAHPSTYFHPIWVSASLHTIQFFLSSSCHPQKVRGEKCSWLPIILGPKVWYIRGTLPFSVCQSQSASIKL